MYGLKYQGFSVEKFWKATKKILLEFYIFLFLAILLNLIFNFSNIHMQDIVDLILFAKWWSGLGHLWYIPLILFCYAITPFIAFFKSQISTKPIQVKLLLKVVLIVIVAFLTKDFFGYFHFPWVLIYVSAFVFAEDIKDIKENFYKAIIPLIFITSMLQYVCNFLTSTQVYRIINMACLWQVVSITRVFTAVTIFIVMYYILSLVKYPKQIKFLDYTDKYSYNIYLCHQIFILGPLSLLTFTNIIFVNIILSLSAIALLTLASIAISTILKKKFKQDNNK